MYDKDKKAFVYEVALEDLRKNFEEDEALSDAEIVSQGDVYHHLVLEAIYSVWDTAISQLTREKMKDELD